MRTAAYARYSTDKQQASSAEDQLRAIRAYCLRAGYQPPTEYRDEAVSGTRPLASRPGSAALLADAAAKRFDLLIMESLDRFSRDVAEQERVVRKLEYWGIRILGLSDGYDTEMGMSKINRITRGMVNELYIDDLRAKTHRGLTGKVESGFVPTGPSYGYIIVKEERGSKFEVEPSAAKWVSWIFDQFAAGWSCQKIAGELNRLKVPAPRGGTWRQSAIFGAPLKGTGILNNELYIGVLHWNRSQWVKDPDTGKRTRRIRPESEWMRKEVPELAIVPIEVWNMVRDRMGRDRRVGGSKGAGRRPTTLFGGLLKCGLCGGAMVAVSAIQYGCAARKDGGPAACEGIHIDRQQADKRLLAEVRDMLTSPAALVEIQQALARALRAEGQGEDRKAMEARSKALQAEIGRLVEAIAVVGLSEALRERLRAAEAEKMTIGRLLNAPLRAQTTVAELMADYRQMVMNLQDALKDDLQEAREIMRSLMGEMIVRQEGDEKWADLKTNPAAAFANSGTSTIVVAGTGFEPVTFGL